VKALVTGGLGFVGVHVVRAMLDAGHSVVSVDSDLPADPHLRFLSGAEEYLRHVQADLTDPVDRWQSLVGEPDVVVHAAAVTPLAPGEELAAAARAVTVNVAATVQVLELAVALGASRVVHVSSGSVYGVPPGDAATAPALLESSPLAPRTVYGITKAAADTLAQRYGELGACEVVVARLAQPYGPMERATGSRSALSPVHDWAVAALAGEPLGLEPGCLDRARDFLYVGDVAQALLSLSVTPSLPHRVYNVSNGSRITLREVREHVIAAAGDTGVVEGRVNLPADAERPVLSPARLTHDTGWTATTTLEDGLAATLAWQRDSRELAGAGAGA
jgi:nucleoside-diphosphate-sugar epimerase